MAQFHEALILLSAVLFFLAMATSWPRNPAGPGYPFSWPIGWAGAFCFVLAGIVG